MRRIGGGGAGGGGGEEGEWRQDSHNERRALDCSRMQAEEEGGFPASPVGRLFTMGRERISWAILVRSGSRIAVGKRAMVERNPTLWTPISFLLIVVRNILLLPFVLTCRRSRRISGNHHILSVPEPKIIVGNVYVYQYLKACRRG